MKNYENVVVFNHPLINHKIAILRDQATSTKIFRELVEEITMLMTYEALREGVPTEKKMVTTPLERCIFSTGISKRFASSTVSRTVR